MRTRHQIVSTPLLLLVGLACCRAVAADEDYDFFEKRIRPVLVKHCYECHAPGADKVQGGLLLHSREGIRRGGETGPAVVPGDAEGSLLLEAIRFESLEMPPDEKLPDNVIADFEKWIEDGAPDPREAADSDSQRPSEQPRQKSWAFQQPEKHAFPPVRQADWPRRKIDWFVLAKLEEAELAPTEPAQRRQLIRRVTFDLTGLPPTPDEVAAFLADSSPNAYERLVGRLLASPEYGQRWARPWLDVARYAEDQAHIVGNNQSLFYPNAYLYRDWVIAALNDDLPYDEFIKLQLAADSFQPDEPQSHAALGFLGLGPKYYRRGDLSVMADEWEDRVDTVARGLMGLTVACARCHDHKFDPISTEDYYALAGVFASTEMFNRPLSDSKPKGNNGHAKAPQDAMHIVRDGKVQDLHVFIRGNVKSKGPVAPRRFLAALCDGEPPSLSTGSGRKNLAEAIVSPGNPMTARVIVNRIWAQHFGRGLVDTPSDFGSRSEPPSHPKLLDDLTVRFVEAGWSLKWLQREIVLSATYRQASRGASSLVSRDPDNRLLGRMSRRRLSVEAWRDALLAVSGQLESRIGGPSIDPQNVKERRRTVYSAASRFELNPMLATFDFPDPNAHAAQRTETITPLQKLFMMNSPFMMKQSQALASRLAIEGGGDNLRRIQYAHQLLFAREVTDAETRLGLSFLSQAGDNAWQQYAHALLASNEMLYVD